MALLAALTWAVLNLVGGDNSAAEDVARLEASIQLFVDQTQKHRAWNGLPTGGAPCLIDESKSEVVQTLYANGALACSISEVPQHYSLRAVALVDSDYAQFYEISFEQGEKFPDEVAIHGSLDDAKASAEILKDKVKLLADVNPELIERRLDDVSAKSVKITLRLRAANIEKSHEIQVSRLYPLSIGVSAAWSPMAAPEFKVSNGRLVENTKSFTLDYYIMLQWYAFSWRPSQTGLHNGRYFGSRVVSIADRFSLSLGASVLKPAESFLVGLSFTPVSGFSITAGWSPRIVHRLQSGFEVGQTIEEGSEPFRSQWDLQRGSIGLTVDGSAFKQIFSFL
jgi:hypothetical protein